MEADTDHMKSNGSSCPAAHCGSASSTPILQDSKRLEEVQRGCGAAVPRHPHTQHHCESGRLRRQQLVLFQKVLWLQHSHSYSSQVKGAAGLPSLRVDALVFENSGRTHRRFDTPEWGSDLG